MTLSRRALAVRPSPTLGITARAKQLQKEGKDVVGLAAGEPDFDTPEHIKDAARRALGEGHTKYTPSSGTPELRAAIASKLARENQYVCAPEDVVVGAGAKFVLYLFFQAAVDEGDEVVIPTPAWMTYADMSVLAGGTPVYVRCRAEDGFALDPAKLRAAITPRTRAVVLNSPSNPTGAVYTPENLAAVARALEGTNAWIVTDDIYEHLQYGGRAFSNLLNVAPELKARTLVVNGVSKAYAMTGWRIGYAAGPRELVAAMGRIADNSTSNPGSISQQAALAALTGPQESVGAMRAQFEKRKDFITARLRSMPGVKLVEPGGAFYAFPDVSFALEASHRGERVGTSARLCEILLNDFGVAVVPGAPFDGEGHVRLSFACSMETLAKGLDRVAAGLAALS